MPEPADDTQQDHPDRRATDSFSKSLDKMSSTVKLMIYAVVIILVLAIGLEIQVQLRNRSIDDIQDQVKVIQDIAEETRESAKDSQQAARAAEATLNKAVEDLSSMPLDPAIAEALAAIHRMEQRLIEHTGG